VQEDDVIIAGNDGLFNNLSQEQIVKVVNGALSTGGSKSALGIFSSTWQQWTSHSQSRQQ